MSHALYLTVPLKPIIRVTRLGTFRAYYFPSSSKGDMKEVNQDQSKEVGI